MPSTSATSHCLSEFCSLPPRQWQCWSVLVLAISQAHCEQGANTTEVSQCGTIVAMLSEKQWHPTEQCGVGEVAIVSHETKKILTWIISFCTTEIFNSAGSARAWGASVQSLDCRFQGCSSFHTFFLCNEAPKNGLSEPPTLPFNHGVHIKTDKSHKLDTSQIQNSLSLCSRAIFESSLRAMASCRRHQASNGHAETDSDFKGNSITQGKHKQKIKGRKKPLKKTSTSNQSFQNHTEIEQHQFATPWKMDFASCPLALE